MKTVIEARRIIVGAGYPTDEGRHFASVIARRYICGEGTMSRKRKPSSAEERRRYEVTVAGVNFKRVLFAMMPDKLTFAEEIRFVTSFLYTSITQSEDMTALRATIYDTSWANTTARMTEGERVAMIVDILQTLTNYEIRHERDVLDYGLALAESDVPEPPLTRLLCKVCGVRPVADNLDHCNQPECVPF